VHADQLEAPPGQSLLYVVIAQCIFTERFLLGMQAYSRLIVTCSTFALYASSFTKSANQAIAAAETMEGDHAMAKRWEFLGKFETNFNHWSVHILSYVLTYLFTL
jgi:gamma-tubulin complex component 2